PTPTVRPRVLAALLTTLTVLGALAGCAPDGGSSSTPTSTSPASAGPGATSSAGPSTDTPAPGSTVAPLPGGELPPGLTLAVVVPSSTADTAAAVTEVEAFAAAHDASVSVIAPDAASSRGEGSLLDPETLLGDAVAEGTDVVVVIGGDLLAALDRVSASTLDQQFVVIGAQLPEPTANVTAVVWPGADSRDGSSPEAEVAPRVGEALAAGLAAVVAEATGYVIALP
ncbi:hypothetical protein, partial [Sanguibacter suaedae]